MTSVRAVAERRAPIGVGALAALALAFLAVGGLGVYRYVWNFWLYRGFAPPRDPAWVRQRGRVEQLSVASAAIGGRRQQVLVYLPPGYSRSGHRRYPVLYLLHGFPGRPDAFPLTVRVGVLEDELVARRASQPLIVVMPFGSTGTFADKEWVNGVRPHEGWETFLARDVVHAIDARYRTVASGAGRAIGGLSEGGYGAIDIAIHHPDEFRLAESWSGYELADPVASIFGGDQRLLTADSPLLELPRVAPALRRRHTVFWFYSGRLDRLLGQNVRFAAELARAHIPHTFFLVPGGHDWRLWREHAEAALLEAGRVLAHA